MKEIAEDTAVPEAIRDVANKGVAVATIPIFDVNRYMRPDAIAFKTPFGTRAVVRVFSLCHAIWARRAKMYGARYMETLV